MTAGRDARGSSWRLCAVAVSVLTVALLFGLRGNDARAYEFLEPKFTWGGSPAKITVFNKIEQRSPAIRQAMKIWNESGVGVRFAEVGSAKKAQVVIEPDRRVGCGNGFAVSTREKRRSGWRAVEGWVSLGTKSRYGTPTECRYVDVLVTAHELGHIIGLDHEDRRCATMNSFSVVALGKSGEPRGVAPFACGSPGPERWFCRTLTLDDLTGAKKLYGGRPDVRDPAFCPIPSSEATGRAAARTVAAPIDDPSMADRLPPRARRAG